MEGSVSLGGSVTLDVNVDNSSIEINNDSLRVKSWYSKEHD